MRITNQEESAVLCLAHVARSATRTTIAETARAAGLSAENAAKIMARLRQLDLVRSIRGKGGGYVLSRPPEQISVAAVLEGLTGRLFEIERCAGRQRGEGCAAYGDCGLRPVWLALAGLVHDFLGSVSLADVLADERRVCACVAHVAANLAPSRLRPADAAERA